MPTSNSSQISKIICLITDINPLSILDIGVGFGKYGVLCREYLEFWDGRNEYTFKRRIDGIEAFKDYLTPLHKFVYNKIYTGNALQLIDKINFSYDLVLLIDVLEHFTKEEGTLLVKKIVSKNKGLLLSTPKKVHAQDTVFKNKYETHKSQWSEKELSNLGNHLFLKDKFNFIIFIGSKEKVQKIKHQRVLNKSKNFFASIPFVVSVYHLVRKSP